MVEPGTMDDLTLGAMFSLNRITYIIYLSVLITNLPSITCLCNNSKGMNTSNLER